MLLQGDLLEVVCVRFLFKWNELVYFSEPLERGQHQHLVLL